MSSDDSPRPPSKPNGGGAAVHDLTGKTVGRFLVRARLGAGGMGEVYRAEDTKLKRAVALKRISPNAATDQSYRNRFLREAERASALSNPHIAAVYDVLEEDGEIFLVMEFVEGVTLREWMKAPFNEKEFFSIARQCAEALAEAHAKGIVHRDIKPENIMLASTGGVKILDFGVARRLPRVPGEETSDPSAPTETSDSTYAGLSGTPAYMAPEVLLEEEADGRADLFSLGVVLYEALTGKHPFRAASFMATCDRILREQPPPLRQIAPRVRPEIEQLINKLLAKKAEDRFDSAEEFLVKLRKVESGTVAAAAAPRLARRRTALLGAVVGVALVLGAVSAIPRVRQTIQAWLGIAPVPRVKHLIVLPFTVIGEDERTRAFGDGLAETLTAQLTKLTDRSTLQVVPMREVRTSGVLSVEQARTEFGVNLAVEGSLQRSGDAFLLTYALVDTSTRRQLRAETITVAGDDAFGVADRVVRGTLAMLELEIRPEDLQARGTEVAHAYDFYLQGRGYLQDFDRPENVENAIIVFGRALALDPRYALAHTGLGEAYWRKYEITHENQWVAKARKECEDGLQSGADLPEAHICLARLLNGTGEYEKAAGEWERALKLEPTSDEAYRGLATAYEHLGQLDRAESTYKRAIALRPHYWASYNYLGVFYYRQARYSDAADMFSQVVALVPDSFRGYSNLGAIYMLQGRYAEAIQTLQRSVEIRPSASGYSNLATAYFHLKKYDEAAQMYEQAAKLEPGDFMLWWNLGDAYYWAPGRRPEAAGAYRKAVSLANEKLAVNPKDVQALSVLAICRAMLGERPAALEALNRSQALAPGDAEVQFRAAVVYTQLGDTQSALNSLAKALAAGYSLARARDDRVFDSLRDDPRFQALLSKGK